MKKQKSKYRFNLIDALLIVLIIAVLGAIYYFVSGENGIFSKKSNNEHKMQYVIELKTVDKDYIDNLENSINKEVVETIRNGVIGKLVGIEVEPSWTITTDIETGEMKKSYYPAINIPEITEETDDTGLSEDGAPDEDTIGETVTEEALDTEELIYDYYNVRLIVEADMQYTGSSYTAGGYGIVVGYPIYFRLPYFVGSGYCIYLEEIE